MVLWVLFLFDDEVEFGPFRFNMVPLTDRGGENMTQALKSSVKDLRHLI